MITAAQAKKLGKGVKAFKSVKEVEDHIKDVASNDFCNTNILVYGCILKEVYLKAKKGKFDVFARYEGSDYLLDDKEIKTEDFCPECNYTIEIQWL